MTTTGARAKIRRADGTVARSVGYPDREPNEFRDKMRATTSAVDCY